MKYVPELRFGLAVVGIACLGSVACQSEPLADDVEVAEPPTASAAEGASLGAAALVKTPAELEELAREAKQVRCHESASPSELSVAWAKTAESSRSQLSAVIRNDGFSSVSAEPVLIAANPSLGETRELRLPAVTVAAGKEAVVNVNVADFPLQSVGEATSVTIGLRWQRPEDATPMNSPQALSQPLFVTHDDETFRTAIAREREVEHARQLAKPAELARAGRRVHRALDATGVKPLRPLAAADLPTAQVMVSASAGELEGGQP